LICIEGLLASLILSRDAAAGGGNSIGVPGHLTAGASEVSCETGGESTGRNVGDTSAFALPASTGCEPGEGDVGESEAGAIDWLRNKDPEEVSRI
jgi:hypothetical protein